MTDTPPDLPFVDLAAQRRRLGDTVERITVGAFRKKLLMQSVAIGVGFGIAAGIVKIAYNTHPLVMFGKGGLHGWISLLDRRESNHD